MNARPRIAIYGSSTIAADSQDYRLAYELGAELARAGAEVMTGGYSGVMEAASRGAAEAGGHVVGVTVRLYASRGSANRWVKETIDTADLLERLRVLTHTADGFVAMCPSLGTLTELHLVWTLLSSGARPPAALVLLGPGWKPYMERLRKDGWVTESQAARVQYATGAAEATYKVVAGIVAPRSIS